MTRPCQRERRHQTFQRWYPGLRREAGELQGSVATLHLKDVPLCCSPDREVEERRYDRLQGQPIRAGEALSQS